MAQPNDKLHLLAHHPSSSARHIAAGDGTFNHLKRASKHNASALVPQIALHGRRTHRRRYLDTCKAVYFQRPDRRVRLLRYVKDPRHALGRFTRLEDVEKRSQANENTGERTAACSASKLGVCMIEKECSAALSTFLHYETMA